MEVDNNNDDNQEYLIQFNEGNYTNCRIILEQIFTGKRENIENRTLNDCILQNNIVVCRCLEHLIEDSSINFSELKFKLKQEIDKLLTLPKLNIDATLALVFNIISLFWFVKTQSSHNSQFDFEEQLHLVLPSLCRVLHGGSSTHVKLDQIKLAFKLSHSTFELLDQRQAALLTAIRVIIALAAQDEFVVKITLSTKESVTLPHAILCNDVDRENQLPILLLPILCGQATAVRHLDVRATTANLNLVFAALLARLKKYKSALQCLTEKYDNLELRALGIYLKAYVHTQSNMKLEAQKLLEGLFSMKAGREGELGCRARILQSRLVCLSGKHQQAVNILRQATKNHGSNWMLLDALANMYAQHNQDETVVRTLELALQCLLTVPESLPTFESRVLHCLHQDIRPSVSKTLYHLANLHCKLKNHSAGSERMLQLLARQEDPSLCDNSLPSLRLFVRETSLVLLQAGKLEEARIVCTRAISCNISAPSQVEQHAKWLDGLRADVTALLLMAHIHTAAHKWHDALTMLDSCICELQKSKPSSSQSSSQLELHSLLLARSLLQTTQVYQSIEDDANTKHAFHKAMHANKNDREIVLLFVRYLLEKGEEKEAHKVWFAAEKHCKRLEPYESADQVLVFLLAPKLSDMQSTDIEKQIKISIINSRK